jgi:hypothetical protein
VTTIERTETVRHEPSPEACQLGAQLDAHHAPETNGWMAVCRRCGARTDGPTGVHTPSEKQLDRAHDWLRKAAYSRSVELCRDMR